MARKTTNKSRSRPKPIPGEPIFRQIGAFKPSKSDLRRMAILEAVIQELATKGGEWINVQSVAEKAGMLRSHVAYYFPNADAMLEAAIQAVVATGQEITVAHLAEASTPAAQIEAWVTANFSWFERYPTHASVMMLLHFLGTHQARYRALNLQIREAGQSRLEAILVAGRNGKNRSRKSAREVAADVRACLLGMLVQFFSAESDGDYERMQLQTTQTALRLAEEYWG